MALADLIRGTAAAECPTVARVATIAVANAQESITSHLTVARVAEVAVANAQKAMLSHQDLETNVESAEFATATLATFATVAGLRAADEAVIRRWLTAIGETDERVIEETVLCCKTDEPSRDWALEQARANLVESGERFGKGSPNSDEPIERIRTDETLADMAGVPVAEASCKRCRHASRYGNCGQPVEAGLDDHFSLSAHPEGGRGCAVFEPDASLREGCGLPKI